MSKPEISFQRIELTYFKEGLVKDVPIKDIKPITSVKEKSKKIDIKTAKLEKIEIELRQSQKIPIEKIDIIKNRAPLISEDERGAKSDTPEKLAKATLVREDYCLKVREEIKSMLEKNGRHFIREGNVYVRFIINRDGTLKDLVLYKKTARGMQPLERIVIKSIKEASPFLPFDDSIKEAELPFDLPIRFTLHR